MAMKEGAAPKRNRQQPLKVKSGGLKVLFFSSFSSFNSTRLLIKWPAAPLVSALAGGQDERARVFFFRAVEEK